MLIFICMSWRGSRFLCCLLSTLQLDSCLVFPCRSSYNSNSFPRHVLLRVSSLSVCLSVSLSLSPECIFSRDEVFNLIWRLILPTLDWTFLYVKTPVVTSLNPFWTFSSRSFVLFMLGPWTKVFRFCLSQFCISGYYIHLLIRYPCLNSLCQPFQSQQPSHRSHLKPSENTEI